MEPQRPPKPPVIDALPIPAADSEEDAGPVPATRYRSRSRQHRSRNVALMEGLSRRMGRQTLVQQGQPSVEQPHRQRRPRPSQATPFVSSDSKPRSPMDLPMEIDVDEDIANDLPSTSPAALPDWMLQRFPSFPAPTPPETIVDPSVEARVLERLNSNAQSAPDSVTQPSIPDTLPVIEVDPSDKADASLEVDEGFAEDGDDLAWLDEHCPTGSGISGVLRSRGILQYTTSSEAALRCTKLVRNVPRMRKRKQKKKEQRLRAASGNNNGEGSQVATDAPEAAHGQQVSAQ